MTRVRVCVVGLAVLLASGAVGFAQAPASAPAKPDVVQHKEPSPDLVQEHPATAAQLHEYYELTHALVNAHKVMRQMADGMQATAAPYYGKAFWDDMRNSFDQIDLEAAFLPAYQKYFSQDDMQKVIDFYKTPAGQRLLSAQPLIVSAAGDVLKKECGELGRAVYLRHKDEIEAAKKASEAGSGGTKSEK